MTKLEAAKMALEQMNCRYIYCEECAAGPSSNICKARRFDGHVPTVWNDGLDENGIRFFTDYIKEHDMTDKDKALEQLKKIEKEEASHREAFDKKVAELRKIIEKPEMVYDRRKIYIGIKDGTPYIMAGCYFEKYFRFHTFKNISTEQGAMLSRKTGQECLDSHIAQGFDIRAFTDTEEALEYFLSVLRSNK